MTFDCCYKFCGVSSAQPGNVMRFPSHGLHASSITCRKLCDTEFHEMCDDMKEI
jgi:hypothetical protein